jgi:hypothetical protein
VLTARYRVLNPFWFNVHAFLQLLAGVFIVVGAALGIEYRNRLPLDVHTQHFVRFLFCFCFCLSLTS